MLGWIHPNFLQLHVFGQRRAFICDLLYLMYLMYLMLHVSSQTCPGRRDLDKCTYIEARSQRNAMIASRNHESHITVKLAHVLTSFFLHFLDHILPAIVLSVDSSKICYSKVLYCRWVARLCNGLTAIIQWSCDCYSESDWHIYSGQATQAL